MGLDFSRLHEIGQTHKPQDERKDKTGSEYKENNTNLTTGQIGALETNYAPEPIKHYPKLEKERAEREAVHETYKQQQDNIRVAGSLRAEITKGIQAGQEINIILLKAIECISLMTGDKLFLEQNKRDLENNLFR